MLVKLAVALLVLSVLEQVVGSDNIDIHDSPPEKPASQKGRLSLQNTGRKYLPAEIRIKRFLLVARASTSTWGLSGHVFVWLQIKSRRRHVPVI